MFFFFFNDSDFNELYEKMPNESGVYIVTGPNGCGKSRFLSHISSSILEKIKNGDKEYNRLICLSGSVSDKFPQDMFRKYSKSSSDYSNYISEYEYFDYKENDKIRDYAYFGKQRNKTNFTELAPFQRLMFYIHDMNESQEYEVPEVADFFNYIGLDPVIEFKVAFKESVHQFEERFGSIRMHLLDMHLRQADSLDWLDLFRKGLARLSDFYVSKRGKKIGFRNLSSGERSSIISMLSLAFSVRGDCIVLYDEPENSLHPEWQLEIVARMWKLISKYSENSKLIVATHSPLIISGSRNSYTHVLDMKSDGEWRPSEMYGNTPGAILKEQFGVDSPRSRAFLLVFQECLDAYVVRTSKPEEFMEKADRLANLHVTFHEEDALYLPYQTLMNAREELKQ
ncbi:AAA family ATPase [Thalassospira australica]|uniref:AAA family ATPase n=1 Tax=Thalassospira australica TaxID=1528106 RepID=UPI003850A618